MRLRINWNWWKWLSLMKLKLVSFSVRCQKVGNLLYSQSVLLLGKVKWYSQESLTWSWRKKSEGRKKVLPLWHQHWIWRVGAKIKAKGSPGIVDQNPENHQNNTQNLQNSKRDIECWNCGKTGHYSNACKSSKKDEGRSNVNTVLRESDDCLICEMESKIESWILDSMASFHATSNRNLFENYISGNLGKVYLGDD